MKIYDIKLNCFNIVPGDIVRFKNGHLYAHDSAKVHRDYVNLYLFLGTKERITGTDCVFLFCDKKFDFFAVELKNSKRFETSTNAITEIEVYR